MNVIEMSSKKVEIGLSIYPYSSVIYRFLLAPKQKTGTYDTMVAICYRRECLDIFYKIRDIAYNLI